MLSTLAAYLHDIDPYAIRLWDGGPIRWYGLSYVLGFYLGYLVIRALARRGNCAVRPDQSADLVISVAIGVVAGGRLGYALFYQPSLFTTFRAQLPFWDLLALNKGGMASHGGLLGLVIAALWHARRRAISGLHLLDLTTFAGSIGLFFGRLANFVNGELYGRPCAADFPLAVKFPQEMLHWSESALALLNEQLASLMPAGASHADVAAWAIEAIQRHDRAVIDLVAPRLVTRHPSQLYEAVLEGLVLFGVLGLAWARPRKPGVIFGLCCAVYALMRIGVEWFREPDAQLGPTCVAGLDLTRGQLLSVGLLAAGLALLAWCRTRPVAPLGGWRRGAPPQGQRCRG